MRRRILVGLGAIVLALGLSLGLGPQDAKPASAGAETFTVDAVHSSVIFKIKHLGVSNFYGAFKDVGGTVNFDEKHPANSSLDVKIKADSLDTRNDKRDQHIKGPQFFDVEKFPAMTFKSSSFKKTGEHDYKVGGDMTFHGVTKPLTVKLQHIGTANHQGFGRLAGFEATFTIKRSDYGVGAYVEEGTLGDDIALTVSLECTVKEQ